MPVDVSEPFIEPLGIRVVQANAKGQHVMAAPDGCGLARVDQRRPDPAALRGRGHFQMIKERYARELAP